MPQPSSRQTVNFKIGDQPVPGYRLVRELGRGTFGIVWLAVTENGFERALKLVNLEQKGGKKEFRALRLIKDRKILHGNLLTLIDYWLLDRDGTIIATPNNVTVDTHIAAPKSGNALAPTALNGAKLQVNVAPGIQGTMIPSGDTADSFNVRDTFQPGNSETAEVNSQAIWLVVAMELGHKTLHDRQKEYTHEVKEKTLTKALQKTKTQVNKKGDTAAGSATIADQQAQAQTHTEEDELSPLTADEVLPYMEQAARGLDYLHRCEIVHRDVKPQNIMLVGDVAKVCDYGLASELGDIRATTNAFTLPYAAPEAINKNQPSPASDQYSLAVTYVELRTGRWPFVSNTSTAVYAAKDTGVHHLKFVPNRNVRTVLKKALSKKATDRYSSCGEFVKQLAKAEATRFNLFATVQAVIAGLAIVTVLLAGIASHPEVWARIKHWFPQPTIVLQPSTFDLANHKSRLESAEKMLQQDQREQALQAFISLHQELPQIPDKEVELRNETILGLARARAGENGALTDVDKKRALGQLIEPLEKQGAPPLAAKQGLVLHYLKVLALEQERNTQVGPDSQLAKDSLADWERQLWRDTLVRHEAPELKNLLDQVIAKRKEESSESLKEAQAIFGDLRTKAATAQDLSANLRHQIDMEELHLNFNHEDPKHAENLQSLKNYLEQEITLEQNLVDRAQLLQLLTLKSLQGPAFSFHNPEVAEAVANLKPELFNDSRLELLHFSPKEIDSVQACRDAFREEVRQSSASLPEASLVAIPQLLLKRDGFQLLCDRVRAQLTNTELKDKQLPAIQAAWQDLLTYQDRVYQNSTLSGRELQDALRSEADLSLEVAFADPKADPAVVLKDFVPRVVQSGAGTKWFQKLLQRAQQDPQWVKAGVSPLQSLLTSPPEDLSGNRQLAEWKAKVEGLLLRDVLHTDPANDAAIQSILSTLSRDAGDGKGPLPTLLRAECELLTANTLTPEKMQELETKVDRALNAIGNADADLKSYGSYVKARLLAHSDNVFQQDEAAKVIGDLLKQSQLPTWLTSARRQRAGDVFAISAIKALKLDDQDILRFADLSLASSSQLAHIQSVAQEARVQTPALQAIAAIVAATQGDANWKQAQEWIATGRKDPQTVALFERSRAGRLLEYVAALTALRGTPDDTPPDPKVVAAFHHLLIAQQDQKFIYFSFAEGPQDDDEGVLQNIINPVLLHPAVAQNGKEPAKELAFLWGAKGRLLQRSPLIVGVDPAKQTDLRDSSTVAITLANQAFDRARQLDNNINYLVGFGRTLAAMPADAAGPDDRLQRLYELVDKNDPQGTSTNLGMRFLSAYVLRFRSYEKNDLPNIRLAGTRYEAVLKDLPADDPFDLDALCREGLSDIHLRLAFLNSQVTTEEIRGLLAGREPPLHSKAYHLQLAVKFATQATQNSSRNQKENAYTALANAYEDYAYYLGLTEYYAKSKDAFGFAISSARDRGLPVAKAQMNYGRCLYRYAIDPFAGLARPEDRIEILKLAVNQLEEAVASGKLRPKDEVEASFWLAVDRRAIGNLSPAAVKLTMYEEALAHYHQASEAATKYQLTDMLLLTLGQESEAALDLYAMYTAAKDPIRQPKVYKQAQAIDETAYQLFAKNPTAANANQVEELASNASILWRGEAPKRTRWIEGSPAIKAQWESKDIWKFEAICLRLDYALLPEGRDEVAKARATLATITDQRLKNQAEARILDFEASLVYKTFEDIVSNQKDITQEKLREEVEKPLVLYIAAKKFHDSIIDSEVNALLDRINATSSTQLKNVARDLITAEKKKLQDVLTRAPDLEFRKRLFKLCNLSLLTMGADPKYAAAKKERARIAHDSIKPFYVFADNEIIFTGLRDLKDKHQVSLDKFESQLKVAGDKFDGKAK